MRVYQRAQQMMLAAVVVLLVGCAGAGPVTQLGSAPAPAGAYTRDQLQGWYEALGPAAMARPGVIWASLDQQAGQLRFGVGSVEAKERVLEEAALLAIPLGAIRIDTPEGLLSEAAPLAGCQLAEGAPGPSADGLTLNVGQAKPGDLIELTVQTADPEGVTRGITSYLECWTGAHWSPRYTLYVAGRAGANGPFATLYSPHEAVDSLGLMGPGPEQARLPDELTPGWYRIRKDVHIRAGERNEQRTVYAALQIEAPAAE